MKLKIILPAFMLLSFLFGYSQETGCAKFKNGTFMFTDPASKKVCIITREGNKQTEKMQDTEDIYEFDIVWLDDCTYTITATPAAIARNKDLIKVGTMTVKLTKIKEASYTQRATVASNPKFRRVDEVFIVPEKPEKDEND